MRESNCSFDMTVNYTSRFLPQARVWHERSDFVPNDAQVLAECEPVYVEFEGWCTPTDKAKTFKQLPARAREYLKAISELTNAKLFIASVGPGRDQTIFV